MVIWHVTCRHNRTTLRFKNKYVSNWIKSSLEGRQVQMSMIGETAYDSVT